MDTNTIRDMLYHYMLYYMDRTSYTDQLAWMDPPLRSSASWGVRMPGPLWPPRSWPSSRAEQECSGAGAIGDIQGGSGGLESSEGAI